MRSILGLALCGLLLGACAGPPATGDPSRAIERFRSVHAGDR